MDNINIFEKIHKIENTNNLNEVSLECLPPIQTDKYYFVSYSHKDYKQVYKDIFHLQASGCSIWYDRGMEAGKNWKDTAEKYITKHSCSGVIFYMSENSILSDAIHEEIKLLIENGKDFLTINLPINGKYMSAKEMLVLLQQKGIEIKQEKIDFISKYLNEDVIYIKYESSYEEKIEKINHLKTSPLFKICEFSPFDFTTNAKNETFKHPWCYHNNNLLYFLETVAINDLEVKEVSTYDFQNSLNEHQELDNLVKINDSTFSNCRKLEKIDLPNGISVIGNHSFYNCEKLTSIDLSNIYLIKDSAFENCINLKDIDIHSLDNTNEISDFVFRNCLSLENIKLPKKLNKIGICAFENTKIRTFSIDYLYGDGICDYAFYNCKELEKVEIIKDGLFEIGEAAFNECLKLKEFILNNGEIRVGKGAFSSCLSLTNFPFKLVKEIKSYAFANCIGLKESLIINACNIEMAAFNGCQNIKEIIFNEDQEYRVDSHSFANMTKLKSVLFADKLKSISQYAFDKCENLETIYLPNNIEYIAEDAFIGCINLKEIHFNGTSKEFEELMFLDFINPWFKDTGEYVVFCTDRIITKYEFK